MTTIYEHHDKAFPLTSAYIVMKDGARVATIAFKHPKDGAGRLWCYLHWLGETMLRGYAGGYGYCKTDAAIASATAGRHDQANNGSRRSVFYDSVSRDDGHNWDWHLREAGFNVFQAV